ncbi:hypothetical protein Tco_0172133 [Tanacetum coccineum]
MPLYSQLEGTRSSVGTAEGSAEARCSSSSSSSSFSSSSSSSLSSLDDSLLQLSYPSAGWHQQIEVDPSLVPLPPHQKLIGISMAQN